MNNNNNNNDDTKAETDCTAMNAIVEETKQPSLRELNQMERILLCFSLETNVKTILNCDKDSKVCFSPVNERHQISSCIETFFSHFSLNSGAFVHSWHEISHHSMDNSCSHVFTALRHWRESGEFSFPL